MTGRTEEARRLDRLFLIAFVPVGVFFAAGMYVRLTSESDPLWSELAGPLLFGLLGLRTALRPSTPETGHANRWVGILLIFVSALLAALAIHNFQGAN